MHLCLLCYAEVKPDGEPIQARVYWRGPYAVTVGRAVRYKGDVEDWPMCAPYRGAS